MRQTFILWNEEKVIGPILQHEIKVVSEQFFKKEPTITDEEFFKLKYPEKYEKQMSTYWIDFTYAKLMSLEFVGKIAIKDSRTIIGEGFMLDKIDQKTLLLRYSVISCKNYISRILLELTEYLGPIFNIAIGEKFYYSSKDNII